MMTDYILSPCSLAARGLEPADAERREAAR